MQTNFLENLKKRFSCKNFDTSKKVSPEDLAEIIEVFRLSPSMLNIQPWKIFVIEDENLKKNLQNFAGNQKQVWENSHLLVFARRWDFDENFLEKISENMKEKEIFKKNISNFLQNFSSEQLAHWADTQVSVALGGVLNFLALKQIDACAIWVFDREKFDEILNLKEKWYASVFNICIWYAKEKKLFIKKNRLKTEDIVEFL